MGLRIDVTNTAEFGNAVKLARKERSGLVQREAAFLVGVSPPFLNKLERGGPGVHLGKVLQVCQNLGIKIILELPDTNSTPIQRGMQNE